MLPHENHWKYWNVLVQVQRFQVGSSDPRKRRDSKGSGVSERWNRAVFRFAENRRFTHVFRRFTRR